MSFDILFQEVGEYGRYQIFYIALLGLGKMCIPMHFLAPIFTAYSQRNFWCSAWGNETTASKLCFPPSSVQNTTQTYPCPATDWRFDTSIFKTTIQSRFLVICDKAYLVNLTMSLYIVGFLLGSTLYGYLSDKFGRIKTELIIGLHGLIISCLTPFAQNIWLYMFGRLLNGIAGGGLLSVINITLSEMTTTKYRVLNVLYGQIIWEIGDFIFILVAFLQRDYLYLDLINGCFFSIPVIVCFILPECPRWLACHGRFDESYEVMKRLGSLSREKFDELITPIKQELEIEKQEKSNATKWEFLRHKHMRSMTFFLWYIGLTVAFINYALHYNSASFHGNPYISRLVMSSPKVLHMVFLFYVGQRLDRVPIMTIGCFLGCICCVLLAIISGTGSISSIPGLIVATSSFLMFGMVTSITWLYIVEAYPTEVRNTGVGTVSTWARVGAMLAPQLMLTEKMWKPFPYVVYSVIAIICSLATLGLPETRNVPTLESLKDGEKFAAQSNTVRRWIIYFCRKNKINNKRKENEEIDCDVDMIKSIEHEKFEKGSCETITQKM